MRVFRVISRGIFFLFSSMRIFTFSEVIFVLHENDSVKSCATFAVRIVGVTAAVKLTKVEKNSANEDILGSSLVFLEGSPPKKGAPEKKAAKHQRVSLSQYKNQAQEKVL